MIPETGILSDHGVVIHIGPIGESIIIDVNIAIDNGVGNDLSFAGGIPDDIENLAIVSTIDRLVLVDVQTPGDDRNPGKSPVIGCVNDAVPIDVDQAI